jgi:hypothetical protein
MTGEAYKPVVSVTDQLNLALDGSGRWVALSSRRGVVRIQERLVWLLPLLEQSYVDVERAVVGAVAVEPSPPPVLARYALEESTPYWIDRALDWLESGFPAASVVDVLAVMKDDRALSQPIRHRALRAWRAARS